MMRILGGLIFRNGLTYFFEGVGRLLLELTEFEVVEVRVDP